MFDGMEDRTKDRHFVASHHSPFKHPRQIQFLKHPVGFRKRLFESREQYERGIRERSSNSGACFAGRTRRDMLTIHMRLLPRGQADCQWWTIRWVATTHLVRESSTSLDGANTSRRDTRAPFRRVSIASPVTSAFLCSFRLPGSGAKDIPE